MKRVRLGQVMCKGVPVYVEEMPVDTLALDSDAEFTVALNIQDKELDLGLTDIRALKRLLAKAEQQILLRNEQATKARNLHLDL